VPSSANLPVLAQVVCADCGHKTYHQMAGKVPPCPACGGELQVVDTLRDRRRLDVPVKRDRRGSDEHPTADDRRGSENR
jgi:hypothetical protein